ncbi:MAG: alpha/beta hydrolase [Acidobacteriota bacterium]|nr:alpha/beta hydrolase [Acidobacteriota bacterium]
MRDETAEGPGVSGVTRRDVLHGALAAAVPLAFGTRVRASGRLQTPADAIGPLDPSVLPPGVRSRFADDVNGLRVHVLEAGFESPGRLALLLLHGFPELAYSWRKIMPPLAAAGFHVFAPDVRGYGRTTPAPVAYDDDLRPFGTLNKINDMLALVSAMGYQSVAAVIGHDQGSPLAGWCACARPDVFTSVVMMSAPFGGPPTLPFNTVNGKPVPVPAPDTIYDELARLTPPRKHYQRYYQTREANDNMWHAKQGLRAFLRAYYHMKSADWPENHPAPLAARTAAEWAKLPRYYVMDLDKGMAEQVAPEMPAPRQIAANRWLPDADLAVYAEEYSRTGFQGGLDGYRGSPSDVDLRVFAGRKIEVPSAFMGGRSDWGVYQNPGALQRLETALTTNYKGTHLVDGAGHWVQQEQPEAISRLLLAFLGKT